MADSTLVHNIMAALHAKFAAVPTTDVNGGMSAIADTIDTYEATVRAPLPQSAAGVGQWTTVIGGGGAAISAPAGGTWGFICFAVVTVNGTWGAAVTAGIVAGGAQIAAASGALTQEAFVWRIA